MNKVITVDQGSLEILYTKYKKLFVPVLIILACVALFFVVVMPQINDIFALQNQNQQTAQKIEQIKTSVEQIQAIDIKDYNNKLTTASSALPPNKEFINILAAVSSAVSDANVNLTDYTFAVGNLATESAQLNKQLSLQMQLTIDGGATGAKQFIQAMSKKLPLAEVTNVQMSDTKSQVTALFFYQPYPSLQFDSSQPINTLSSKDLNILQLLSGWEAEQAAAPSISLPPPASTTGSPTPSGTITPTPTNK